jgi:hypothetical protein
MRIGFIGGHKAGSSRGGVAEDYESKNLPWEIKIDKPQETTRGFQNTISISIGRDCANNIAEGWRQYPAAGLFRRGGIRLIYGCTIISAGSLGSIKGGV